MKKTSILILLTLLALGQTTWAQFSGGTGTAEDPYLISSKDDWNALHNQVKNGNLYTGQYFKMTADIGTVTTPIGKTGDGNASGNYFEGTFDGNGHILTVNFAFTRTDNIGAFCRLNNATIKNLHVKGKIEAGDDPICSHYGGIAGRTSGNTNIVSCRSSVNIDSYGATFCVDADDGEYYYYGGFVGRHDDGTLTFVNCLFDGKFYLVATNYVGGFVGARMGGKISLVNCLSATKKFEDDFWSDHSSTFVSKGDGDNVAMYHCIFTKKCGDDKDGVDARDWTGYFVFNYLGGYNGGWDWDLLDEVFPMYNHDIDLSPYLFSGSGTETSPYLIQNANDWEGLVRNIYLWRTYSGKHFKLTNDITLSESLASEHSTMLGVTKHASFQGIFDGNGHTITVNYTDNGDEHYCGPFRYINGATIKNLHVTGTIYKEKKKHIGGLVGKAYGTNRIINCRSSVDIQANTDGDGSHGGFLGDLRDGTTTFISCLFDGKLQGTRTKKWGGFVGWVADGEQANFINCVFDPEQVNVKDDGNRTFARRNDGDDVSFTNCYYFQTLGSAQGKEACSISADEHVTMTPYGTEEPGVNGGITSYLILDYNPCVMYGGVLYSGNGDQVKLNLSLNGEPVEDYSTDHFIASAGTISSSTNPRTLTMPNEDVTISLAPTALNLYNGDINDPFLIYTFEQWKEMCSHINNGESVPYIGGYYSEKYYKLMADITITETHSSGNSEVMVGISTNDHTKFGGTFDGNGHTITLAITDNSSDDYCAPFRYLKNGTIKNLHVAGTIVKTNKKNAGGLVGKAEGQNQIKNCRSSVDIRFNKNGDVSSGGFVGELRDGSNNSTEFYNCLFDGELYGTDAYCWGGFVGWVANDCWARFSKCFFNPTDVNFDINDGNDNSKTFARFNSGDGTVIVNSCYYTTLINDAQGSTNANGIDKEQLRFNLGHGWEIITENSVDKVVPIMKKYSLSGEGTEASPYLITSTDDWNGLADNVYLGETYSDEFLQLTDNITVNRMIGTGTTSTLWDDYSFSGTFDGAGNTLTFDYSTNVGTEGLIAPFRFVDGATIKNLVVDGTIVAANKYAAGIIGRVDGNTALTNCRSSVTINSSVAGEGCHGGLIGLIRSGYSATITGCIFDGKLLGGSTTHCGGLVGLAFSDETYSATVNIINSLYAPAELTEGETWISATGSHTLARYTNNGQATITNSYYMQTLGTAQGKQARTISGSENVIVENAGTATEYDVSGITSYGTGIGLTSIVLSEGEEGEEEEVEEKEVEEVEVVVLYAGNGDHVSLNLTDTVAQGYTRSNYVVNAGTLTGNDNGYTLVMPNEDVTISANINVAEWEGDGSEGNPYLIYNNGQLDMLATRVNGESSTLYNDKYYKLMDDIIYNDSINNNYTAIGNDTRSFKGHFDGNDNTISGIRINRDNQYQGLFGYIGIGGEVKNVTLIDTDITGPNYTGGIAGFNNCGTINHCHVTSSVYIRITTVGSYHGGVVGSNEGTSNDAAVIKNCISSATLTTTTAGFTLFGGIAGNNGLGGRITDNLAIGATGPEGIYGIITAPNQNGSLERNYYVGCTVGEAENVTGKGCANGDLTLNDGAVPGNVRTISGYGDSETNHWAFIASPLTADIEPTSVENFLTASEYDLYRLNPSTNKWENWKNGENNAAPGFSLENGRGYLYATQAERTIKFTDNYNLNDTVEVTLSQGFNLVGNPFPRAAYIGKPYYTLNSDGSAVLTTTSTNFISPCYGVVVEGTADETVTFSTTALEPGEAAANNGSLQIMLSQALEPVERAGVSASSTTLALDNAIVSFNEGARLGKFYFGKQNANIYLPQGGEEYAIVSVGTDVARNVSTEIPINFKANENGTYTLTVNPEGVEMDYLHLVDNMTGADVDLLAMNGGDAINRINGGDAINRINGGDAKHCVSTYTFEAKTTDFESRFKLVFVANNENGPSTGSGAFAFISNGNIVVNGEGTLQVLDVMGRVIRVCTDVARNVSTQGMPAGVYVLRLINGKDVKTQKIVVR